MRRVMIGLGLLGLVQSALAADLDYPYLRGSNIPTYRWGWLLCRWSGRLLGCDV